MEATPLEIRKAVVVGAGTMGAQIAAMLANVGIPSVLLDVVPSELTKEEKQKGLTLKDPAIRNRITRSQWERALKLSPSPLYVPESAELVTIGNIEDDLGELKDADWIVEAVVEKLDVKKAIHAKIAEHARDDAIITTNTSGIPIAAISEGLPEARRRRFFGSHFFNPPRVMRLLEVVPGPETERGVWSGFSELAEVILAKGIVLCKDTPGFISNRIGYFAIQHAVWLAQEEGLTVEEADAITGPAMGRPKSATFRLCDLIGLDLVAQIGHDLLERLPADERNHFFDQPAFVKAMIERGWLGEKGRQGYYKRVRSEKGTEIQAIDLKTLEYRPARALEFASLKAGIGALCATDDRAGRFAWKHLSAVLRYSADKVLEIAHNVPGVDEVLRWGFNWDRGPVEIWDLLGVKEAAGRMEKDGDRVPEVVVRLLESGQKSFYERRGTERVYFDFKSNDHQPDRGLPFYIHLNLFHEDKKVVVGNAGASLLNLGDGVACLEFHSKMNALGPEQLEIFEKAKEEVRKNFVGLVIGNQGPHFSAGVNLKLFVDHIQCKDWEGIDKLLARFQRATCGWAGFEKPVVVACHGYALGAGCETVLGAEHVIAAAETYIGLPEIRVGLIPGAGGCKEMLVRALEWGVHEQARDFFPMVAHAWRTILAGQVTSCAQEAFKNGYLRAPPETFVVLNPDWLISEAKTEVLDWLKRGWQPMKVRPAFPALGSEGISRLKESLETLRTDGKLTEHDATVGADLAWVLCGGNRKAGAPITEQDVLDLEREAFLRLCGQPKTLERIEHMLKTGKPLKN